MLPAPLPLSALRAKLISGSPRSERGNADWQTGSADQKCFHRARSDVPVSRPRDRHQQSRVIAATATTSSLLLQRPADWKRSVAAPTAEPNSGPKSDVLDAWRSLFASVRTWVLGGRCRPARRFGFRRRRARRGARAASRAQRRPQRSREASSGRCRRAGPRRRQLSLGDQARAVARRGRGIAGRLAIDQYEQDPQRVAQLDGLGELVDGGEHDRGACYRQGTLESHHRRPRTGHTNKCSHPRGGGIAQPNSCATVSACPRRRIGLESVAWHRRFPRCAETSAATSSLASTSSAKATTLMGCRRFRCSLPRPPPVSG
jgi:hypothetical protein